MIVGPTVGGQVAHYFSEQASAWVSASMILLAIIIVLVAVPAQTKDPRRVAAAVNEDKESSECKFT